MIGQVVRIGHRDGRLLHGEVVTCGAALGVQTPAGLFTVPQQGVSSTGWPLRPETPEERAAAEREMERARRESLVSQRLERLAGAQRGGVASWGPGEEGRFERLVGELLAMLGGA